MATHRQMMIKIERMFKQIIEQNDEIMAMMESRLPEKKKRGRVKVEPEPTQKPEPTQNEVKKG